MGYLIVIKNAIKNTEDEDLDDSFAGVFPSNYLDKFINHAAMISEKKENIPSLLLTLTVVKWMVHAAGVY